MPEDHCGVEGPVRPVDAVAQLCQLGVAEEAAKWMVQYIDERGYLLLQWSVDAGATALAEPLHRHAWFSVGDFDTVVTSRTGGRQGCKLGALTFNSAYGIVLDILAWEMSRSNLRKRW